MCFGKAIVHEYPCHQNCVLKSQRKLKVTKIDQKTPQYKT